MSMRSNIDREEAIGERWVLSYWHCAGHCSIELMLVKFVDLICNSACYQFSNKEKQRKKVFVLSNINLVPLTPNQGPICSAQGDYAGFDTGNGEKLSCSQAEPGKLLCCSLVSLHFCCWILRSHPVQRWFGSVREAISCTKFCTLWKSWGWCEGSADSEIVPPHFNVPTGGSIFKLGRLPISRHLRHQHHSLIRRILSLDCRYNSRCMRSLRRDVLGAFEKILSDLDQRSSIHAV